MSERVHKSLLNAKVNLLFYFLALFLSFFSRKIFLDCLGAEFIGLTGTLMNILGYLNLAELGIGSCISFFLYKPLQAGNRQETQEILSVFGYLYRLIGYIILAGGLVVSLFFPIIFRNETLSMGIIYFAFFAFLGSSLTSYFINYRQVLLSADQKGYMVAIYLKSANLVKTIIQILLAWYYQNLYVWVAIELVFSILGCIVLNWKIDREYPWLETDKRQGRSLLKKYPGIIKNTRQIFVHQIKDFLLMRSDELFVFAFVSLKMVAYYGNYTLIISRTGQMFSAILDSIGAGVGNLIAEGNRTHIMRIFWELMTIRHTIAAFLCFAIFHFIEPFISLWLGAEYILDREILILMTVYIYISTSRGVVDMFNHAHGLYGDTWSAWAELALNVSVTIVAGYLWGIAGILLGKILATLPIIVFWKPYYLFTSGLHVGYGDYWRGAIRNFGVSAVSIGVAHVLLGLVTIEADTDVLSWMLYCTIGLAIYLPVNAGLTLACCHGAKDSVDRVKNKVKWKK